MDPSAGAFLTEDLDAAVVEIEPDLVGDLAEVLAVDQFDGVWVVVLAESLHVFSGGSREAPRRHDHPAPGPVEVERRDGGVEFLDDGSTDDASVLTLDDDGSPGTVDDLLHEHVLALVGRSVGLADVLVAEFAEDVLHEVLELEPREVVQDGHLTTVTYHCIDS